MLGDSQQAIKSFWVIATKLSTHSGWQPPSYQVILSEWQPANYLVTLGDSQHATRSFMVSDITIYILVTVRHSQDFHLLFQWLCPGELDRCYLDLTKPNIQHFECNQVQDGHWPSSRPGMTAHILPRLTPTDIMLL